MFIQLGRIGLRHFRATRTTIAFHKALVPHRQLHHSFPLCEVVPFHLSDIGEGIKEVTVKEWFVKEGDKVNQFDQICEVQSDKASVTITSRFDGVIKKLHYQVDELAQTGDPLVDIEVEDTENQPKAMEVQENEAIHIGKASDQTSSVQDMDTRAGGKGALATPAVRRMAAQHNLNLADVQGSGKDGRVMKEDILKYIEEGRSAKTTTQVEKPQTSAPKASKPAPPAAPAPPPQFRISRSQPSSQAADIEKPFTPFTRAMTKSMTAALQIPHFGYNDEIDVTNLVSVRGKIKGEAERVGVKLSYMPFFVKAASMALLDYPVINSSIDVNKEKIIFKTAHNIGVAMDTPDGLIVPNIKSVQELTLLEIAAELNRLADLGVRGKLGGDDLKGGTFTISNIGSIGGTYASPVIMPPEVAIGALGKMQVLPRFVGKSDQIMKAHVMNVSWSADHRVIDGATMARFSNKWKMYLEQPDKMLLNLK